MNLTEFFKSHSFSSEDSIKFASLFKTEQVKKGQKLFDIGQQCKKVYFIEQGLLRTYYLKDGKDITHHFVLENTFYLSLESIFYDNTSPYGLESLEAGMLCFVHYSEIEKLIDLHPQILTLMNFLLVESLKGTLERLQSLQFQSAQDRYKNIIDKNPDLLLRASLGHIASYLGITQQTLSVLRAQR
jgi:CRP-like cAMP-binding protein